MDELAALLARIPEAVLSLYKEKWDSARKTQHSLLGTDWVDLGDLQTWLGGQDQFRHYLVGPVCVRCNVFSLAAIDIGTSASVLQTDILDLESLYRTADDYLDLFSANMSRHYSGYSTPSSGYSFDPYNELESAFTDQSSARTAPSSEYDFSDFSSAGSALDVHNDLSLQDQSKSMQRAESIPEPIADTRGYQIAIARYMSSLINPPSSCDNVPLPFLPTGLNATAVILAITVGLVTIGLNRSATPCAPPHTHASSSAVSHRSQRSCSADKLLVTALELTCTDYALLGTRASGAQLPLPRRRFSLVEKRIRLPVGCTRHKPNSTPPRPLDISFPAFTPSGTGSLTASFAIDIKRTASFASAFTVPTSCFVERFRTADDGHMDAETNSHPPHSPFASPPRTRMTRTGCRWTQRRRPSFRYLGTLNNFYQLSVAKAGVWRPEKRVTGWEMT
ncbi:hypothetical protein B0H14DRAFT_2655643 [Mycena olivaceomarginata]|nr:hypothetical protein B0H14DRAFT_2655643 [Mycena olivaceomarginata]